MAKTNNSEILPIDSLSLDPANLRIHDERNSDGIEASLKRFGPARSIVVDGNGVVRAGNGTLDAAKRAGFTEVLVVDPKPGQLVAVRRKEWSPSEATGYGIADNRLTDLSTFAEPELAETLRALQSEDFDLGAIGYTDGEVDGLLDGLAKELVGDGEWSDAIGGLPDGDKSPFQQMTFTLADEQAATVQRAMDVAKNTGPFVGTGNENSNGNALARIAEAYLAHR